MWITNAVDMWMRLMERMINRVKLIVNMCITLWVSG